MTIQTHAPERRAAVTLVLGAALAVWVLLVALGFREQMAAMAAPGPESDVPARWPADAPLRPSATGPTVLHFAHPRCPCTPAGLRALGERAVLAPSPAEIHVVFLRPAGAGPEWSSGAAWDAARSIPGARLHEDADGALARRFGALSSGLTAVYGPDGLLRFRGGVTSGRGVEGRSAGSDALDAALAGRRPPSEATPVYGCPIFDEPGLGKGTRP